MTPPTPTPRLVVALILAAVAACGGGQRPGATDRTSDDAVVQLACEVRDAEVYVNDRLVGRIERLSAGIALSPGSHRLEIRHDDYHTAYYELSLAKREQRKLSIELAPLLP